MEIIDLLTQEESNWLDFKREWYHSNLDLIHDILCMSNSLAKKEKRYIVIGVDDSHEIIGIEEKSKKWTTENITQTLLSYMSVIPNITIDKIYEKGKRVDFLGIIPKKQDLPYVLDKKQYEETIDRKKCILFQNVVYARHNSRNTPKNQGAEKTVLERLICRKKGLDLSPTDRFDYYIQDINKWVCPQYNENLTFYYNQAEGEDFQISVQETKHWSLCSYEDVKTYADFIIISGLNDIVWKWKKHTGNCSIEEGFSCYSVSVKLKSTVIRQFNIIGLNLKHEPFLGFNEFFVPEFKWNEQYNRKDLINSPEYQVCRLMCKWCNKDKHNDQILDYLNWEYLEDSYSFRQQYASRLKEERTHF